jgi:hypothetical protein
VATDINLTLSQLNELFQTLTMSILGLDSAKPASAYAVRISWPTGGAPAWKIKEDVCFLKIVEQDNPYNRQRERSFDGSASNQATSYTRVINVSFVFYGPNSFDHAQTVRDGLFAQTNHDTLSANNLYMVPDIAAPVRCPELFEGQWWERVNVNMNFNELVVKNTAVNSLNSVTVTLKNGTITETIIVNP